MKCFCTCVACELGEGHCGNKALHDAEAHPNTWTYTHNRGYGGTIKVPCRIVKRGPKRVQIAALLASGAEKLVWVTPEKLVCGAEHAAGSVYCALQAAHGGRHDSGTVSWLDLEA